jgi:hypothetical protein
MYLKTPCPAQKGFFELKMENGKLRMENGKWKINYLLRLSDKLLKK